MDYSNKSLADFYSLEGKDIFQTAREFQNYINWLYQHEYYYPRRISYTGSNPRMDIHDIYTGEKKEMINFSANDYLNLVKHPKTIQSGVDAVKKYGTGAGSVPILAGTLDLHVELEKKLARFKHCEDSIIYTSGFGSNMGTLLAMLKKDDLAVIDQYAHASIADGCIGTTLRTFKHNDMNSLEKIMKINSRMNYKTKIICVDGVYSMDGDIANLPEIVTIARQYNAYVYVDDAHATGVIGENGKGTAEYYHMQGQVDIVAGTLSKALGSTGGFIASNKELVNYLRFYSRPYMFSTAMTPQTAASLMTGLDVIEHEPEIRKRLWNNIYYLKNKLSNLGLDVSRSESAIFPVIMGSNLKVMQMMKYLHKNNIMVSHVSYPAVPVELSRIRISLMQGHTQEDMDYLVYHLEKKGKELGII